MYGEDEPAPPRCDKYFGYYGNAFYWFVVACIVGALCAHSFERVAFYDTLNAKTVREATIVDAWPYNTGKNHSGREQWEGTFRDNITGHFYTYEMGGGLYQKFLREKSGNGIPVTVSMSPSRAGVPEAQGFENLSVAWDLVRIFSSIVTAVLLIICLGSMHTGYCETEKKRKEAEAVAMTRKAEHERNMRRARHRE